MNRRREVLERWQAWTLLAAALAVGSWWRAELAEVEVGLARQEQQLEAASQDPAFTDCAAAARDLRGHLACGGAEGVGR